MLEQTSSEYVGANRWVTTRCHFLAGVWDRSEEAAIAEAMQR